MEKSETSECFELKHLILNSNSFDKEWFKDKYNPPENVDLIYYYLKNWEELKLDPSPDFNSEWYLKEYPDVKINGANPFVHYIKYGKNENRLPLPYTFDEKYKRDYSVIFNSDLFDREWFKDKYNPPENVDLIYYYLKNWEELKLDPSPDFNSEWYLKEYPDVKINGVNPFVHYVLYGKNENRLPLPYTFDEKYKRDYSVIFNSGLFDREWFKDKYNPPENVDLIYYYLKNWEELKLDPSLDFNSEWYLKEYPDVKINGVNPFVHYVLYGKNENRLPLPYTFDEKYKRDYSVIFNSGLFDREWFKDKYNPPENVDLIYYYLKNWEELKLDPSPDFNSEWYYNEYIVRDKTTLNPFTYYLLFGKNNGHISKLYDVNEIKI